ncbi:MAG: T9SS type A sorting domain-containing protein [Bacteroidota bacterium]
MQKKLLVIPFLLISVYSFCQEILYVPSAEYPTILDAYNAIEVGNDSIADYSYEILIDSLEAEIGDFGDDNYWVKSGDETNNITIRPSDNVYNPQLKKSDGVLSRNYSIDFKDVEYIHVEGITFPDAQTGIHLVNSNYCTIESCVFIINYPDDENAGGGGAIEIKGEVGENKYSTNNLIKSNLIYCTEEALSYIGINGYNKWQGIYLGDNTNNNLIVNNTVLNALGNGIQMYHENYSNNTIKHNFVTLIDSELDVEDRRRNILLGGYPTRTGNIGNSIVNNFINSSDKALNSNLSSYKSFSKYGDYNNLLIHDDIDHVNVTQDNVEFFHNVDNEIAIDPNYFSNWVNTDLNMNIVGVLSGNFDSGNDEEIAVLFDAGDNTTQIHVWKKVEEQGVIFLKYSGLWWQSNIGSFDANQVAGRLVVGDFTGEGRDDIAGFRDEGNGNSKIVLWAGSSAGRFNSESNRSPYVRWTSNPSAFDANQITGRLIAGDFTGDSITDIAGFRDYGNGNSKILVWAGSSAGKFNPDNGAFNWWESNPGAFDANQLTGRLVAGDFVGNDGLTDIAGLRDYGNGNSKMLVWAASSSRKFNPDNGAFKWWESNTGAFDANQVTDRLLVSDFTGDNIVDIAGLRDEGNGNTTIVLWATSSSGKFNPDGYAHERWRSDQGEFINEDAKSVIAIDNSIIAFSHQIQDNQDYSIIAWDNDNGYFDKTNDMNYVPWIIDYNSEIYFNNKSNNGGRMALEEIITSFELDEEKSLALVVYPNPAGSDFNVSFNMERKGILNISIIDLSGKEVFQKTQEYELGSHLLEIKLEGIKSGLYSLHGTIGDHSFINKIFIEN